MTFTEDLQTKKNNAKQAYIKACNEWKATRTPKNITGDSAKWKILCDKKRDCMLLGVRI